MIATNNNHSEFGLQIMASSSSSSPSASPDEAHSTLESGTVTDGIKSVDIPDHNSHVNHTDLPTRIHVASRYVSDLTGYQNEATYVACFGEFGF